MILKFYEFFDYSFKDDEEYIYIFSMFGLIYNVVFYNLGNDYYELSFNTNYSNSIKTENNVPFSIFNKICEIIKIFIENNNFNEILIHPIDNVRYKLFIRNLVKLKIKHIKNNNCIRIIK